jgi:Tol biopolymer transport system component
MKYFKVWVSAILILMVTACTSPASSLTLIPTTSVPAALPATLSPTLPPAQVFDPTNKILFTSTGTAGWELFTINADGTDLKQITNAKSEVAYNWSPDGQYIAFITFPDGLSLDLILNVINADGSELHMLTNNATNHLEWSPDSNQIAFTSKRNGFAEIYIVSREEGDARRLIERATNEYANDVYSLSWSPDGQKIAFTRGFRLYIVNADGTGETALLSKETSVGDVMWSPDGQHLGLVMLQGQQAGLYTLRPDGSDLQKVIDIPSDFTGIDWSPDGTHFLYTQKVDGIVSLFIVDVTGENNLQLAPRIIGASWSPDSQRIVYASVNDRLESSLYIIDIDGQNQTLLPGNNTFDSSPLWFRG